MVRMNIANNVNINPCFLITHLISHLSYTRVKITKPQAVPHSVYKLFIISDYKTYIYIFFSIFCQYIPHAKMLHI